MRENKTYKILYSGEHDARWLELRRVSGIGASESPIILGLAPWSSPYELYGQKLGLLDRKEETEAMRWGLILEKPILEEFARESGRRVQAWGELLQANEPPFLTATPDGWQESEEYNGRGLVQVKTTAYRASDWDDGVPSHVFCQIQHEMAVTGAQWSTAVVLLHGSKMRWRDVERDDNFIRNILVPAVRDFWERLDRQDPPPEVDGSEATKKALAAIYPLDNQETIKLDGDYILLDAERETLQEQKKLIDFQLREIDNKFRAAMRDNTYALLPDGTRYSLKTQTRKAYTVPEKTYRVLRASKGDE